MAFVAVVLSGWWVGACGSDDGTVPSIVTSPRGNNVCGILFEVQLRLGGRVKGATPDALDFGRYPLQADATFASPAGTTCTDAIAGSLTALCDPCQANPADCEVEVRALFLHVPPECSRCGDEVCYQGENDQSCPPDCADTCGDGLCSAVELAVTCPLDCAVPCGDGRCALAENVENCPADCRFSVGDGVCEPGETPENSPQDCGFATCGDGFCQTYEDALRCPEDCCWPRVCSDGYHRCRDAYTIEVCEPSGAGACPELVVGEQCPLGCVDDPLGIRTHCRTCQELITTDYPGLGAACAPESAPGCSGNTALRCQALSAFPQCGTQVSETCSESCVEGTCLTCDEDCALSSSRCMDDGTTIEACVLVAPGCQRWTPVTGCGLGCAGAPNQERCATCEDVLAALERPELGPGCELAAGARCQGDSLTSCQPIQGGAGLGAEACGHEVLTACGGGLACLGEAACGPCAPETCVPGTRRCALANEAVEVCTSGHAQGANCTGWTTEACTPGRVCRAEGETSAWCTSP